MQPSNLSDTYKEKSASGWTELWSTQSHVDGATDEIVSMILLVLPMRKFAMILQILPRKAFSTSIKALFCQIEWMPCYNREKLLRVFSCSVLHFMLAVRCALVLWPDAMMDWLEVFVTFVQANVEATVIAYFENTVAIHGSLRFKFILKRWMWTKI